MKTFQQFMEQVPNLLDAEKSSSAYNVAQVKSGARHRGHVHGELARATAQDLRQKRSEMRAILSRPTGR